MKGQTGLEVLFAFGFLVLVFAMAFVSFLQRSSDVDFASNLMDARKVCDTANMTSITVSGDGTGTFNAPAGTSINTTAVRYTVTGISTAKHTNDCYLVNVAINYNLATAGGSQPFSSTGVISGISS
jgi:hypothetical protein